MDLLSVRRYLNTQGIDALYIYHADPHLSEYVPEHWQAMRAISHFTGSAGSVIITQTEALLFVDSRYWVQAHEQASPHGFRIVKLGQKDAPSPREWLAQVAHRVKTIGLDYELISVSAFQELERSLQEHGQTCQEVKLDTLWEDERPAKPATPIKAFVSQSASTQEKLDAVREAMRKAGADNLVVNALDEIAWVLNLRANDVPYNPVFLSSLILTPEHTTLFVESERLTAEARQMLGAANVTVVDHTEEAFSHACRHLTGVTLLDLAHSNYQLFLDIGPQKVKATTSPITLLKSHKTPGEIASIRQAMIDDGIALVNAISQLHARLAQGETLTENGVAELFFEARRARPDFLELSFSTISAFAEHAALPHYNPQGRETPLKAPNLLLVDSGAHYRTGTTDITRMFAIGEISDAQKRDVTLVLKAMIALSEAIVPEGTAGAQLDALARTSLWREGLDFGHGTGHGVGFVLNVHEGPFYVTPRASNTGALGLQIGNVFSNEPGLYREGQWGVRIENLLVAQPYQQTEFGTFLKLETLTLCPIDLNTLEVSLLTTSEKQWLNQYHLRVRELLIDQVNPTAQPWLIEATRAI